MGWLGILSIFVGGEAVCEPPPLDLNPELIEESPVLQRWLQDVPNVLEDIQYDPSFRTRVRLGYQPDAEGLMIGIEDIFVGRTGLTLSADYQSTFDGDRSLGGANLHYYLLPLGSYFNIAPVLGYRYLENNDYSTDGVNVGARIRLTLSRTGAADIVITQSFISPGGEEAGLFNLSFGYAVTSNVRLSTDFQQLNSREDHESQFGIGLEWML